jgi:hypothetical protein
MGKKQERRQKREGRQQGRAGTSSKPPGASRSPAGAPFLSQGQLRLEQWLVRRRRWVWGGLLLALAALYGAVPSNELGGNFGGDDVQYLLLSKALAGGLGYVDLYLPEHPPHTKYPPLFPLLLAPFNLLGSHQLLGVHILICILALGVPLALAGWVRRQGYSETASVAVFLLSATLPRYYQFLVHVLSEVPFMLFCYFALYWTARSASHPKARDLAVILLATLAALFTRSAGMALVAAIGLELLRRAEFRRWRLAGIPAPIVFGLVTGLAFLAWTLRNRGVGGPSLGYFQEMMLKDVYRPQDGSISLAEFAARVYARSYIYFTVLAMEVTLGAVYIIKPQIHYYHVPLFIPVAVGFISRLFRAERSLEWFFLFSVLLVLSWWSYEDRFLIPLLPLASFYLVLGLRRIAGAAMSRLRFPFAWAWARGLAGAMVLLILLHQGWVVAETVKNMHTDRLEPAQPVAITHYGIWKQPVVNWAKYEWGLLGERGIQMYTRIVILSRIAGERVPAGQVILSRKPTLTAWFTGRPSVCYLFTDDVKAQWEFLRRNRVAYMVVLGPRKETQALFESCPGCFQEEVMVEDGFPALYKVKAYPDEGGSSK